MPMRRKLGAIIACATLAIAGLAVTGLTTGTAAISDTTTATTTGTTGSTTGSTTTGSTTTAPPSTATVTVTVARTQTIFVPAKVTLCHRVGTARHHRFVLVRVAASAVSAHLHHGDKPVTRGSCASLNRSHR